MSDFLKKALNFGIRNGLNTVELALALCDGRRCTHGEYLELCRYFKKRENVSRYYSGVEYN